MKNKINELTSEMLDKMEKEKLEDTYVYTVEIGYNKWSTTDKDKAFELWKALAEGFFTLDNLNSEYNEPKFTWKKPIEVKLVGEIVAIWQDMESAQRACNAFKAMQHNASNKTKKE